MIAEIVVTTIETPTPALALAPASQTSEDQSMTWYRTPNLFGPKSTQSKKKLTGRLARLQRLKLGPRGKKSQTNPLMKKPSRVGLPPPIEGPKMVDEECHFTVPKPSDSPKTQGSPLMESHKQTQAWEPTSINLEIAKANELNQEARVAPRSEIRCAFINLPKIIKGLKTKNSGRIKEYKIQSKIAGELLHDQ
ncbi:hypothetical protein CR513_13734, partial [Mucuna pruriens]